MLHFIDGSAGVATPVVSYSGVFNAQCRQSPARGLNSARIHSWTRRFHSRRLANFPSMSPPRRFPASSGRNNSIDRIRPRGQLPAASRSSSEVPDNRFPGRRRPHSRRGSVSPRDRERIDPLATATGRQRRRRHRGAPRIAQGVNIPQAISRRQARPAHSACPGQPPPDKLGMLGQTGHAPAHDYGDDTPNLEGLLNRRPQSGSARPNAICT